MTPSEQIDNQISALQDWRGELMEQLRVLILHADPEMKEEWKWETGVWNHNGPVCALAAFKNHVKINFFKGAFLPDENELFNSGLEAKNSRGIDFQEDTPVDESALRMLIQAAVAYNQTK